MRVKQHVLIYLALELPSFLATEWCPSVQTTYTKNQLDILRRLIENNLVHLNQLHRLGHLKASEKVSVEEDPNGFKTRATNADDDLKLFAIGAFTKMIEQVLCGHFMCLYGSTCKIRSLSNVFISSAASTAGTIRSILEETFGTRLYWEGWSMDYELQQIRKYYGAFPNGWFFFKSPDDARSMPNTAHDFTLFSNPEPGYYFPNLEWLYVHLMYALLQEFLDDKSSCILQGLSDRFAYCECPPGLHGLHCENCK
ncbi:uncharacterized protein LOC120341866 [Styela clava]